MMFSDMRSVRPPPDGASILALNRLYVDTLLLELLDHHDGALAPRL